MSDTSPRDLDDELAFNRRLGFYPCGYDSPEASSSSSPSSEWQSVVSDADQQDVGEEQPRCFTGRWTRLTSTFALLFADDCGRILATG